MVGMIARAQLGGWRKRTFQGMCARDARNLFGRRTRERCVGGFMAIVLLWCNSALAAEPRVLLLRGWFGVFSTGLDGLAEELKAQGINAEVAGHLHWATAVSD